MSCKIGTISKLLSASSSGPGFFSLIMHFGSESDVLARMMATNSPGDLHPGMILGLCEGRPESEELERIFEVACNQRLPGLIGAAPGVSPELRAWCLEEMNHQIRGTEPPQIGVDLLHGKLRPVVHSLLDALSQSG
jgi:hypothetical protein